MAHPMAALEVVQSAVPLGVKISHVGESPVKADMVTIGDPSTSAGALAALSETAHGVRARPLLRSRG